MRKSIIAIIISLCLTPTVSWATNLQFKTDKESQLQRDYDNAKEYYKLLKSKIYPERLKFNIDNAKRIEKGDMSLQAETEAFINDQIRRLGKAKQEIRDTHTRLINYRASEEYNNDRIKKENAKRTLAIYQSLLYYNNAHRALFAPLHDVATRYGAFDSIKRGEGLIAVLIKGLQAEHGVKNIDDIINILASITLTDTGEFVELAIKKANGNRKHYIDYLNNILGKNKISVDGKHFIGKNLQTKYGLPVSINKINSTWEKDANKRKYTKTTN